MAKNNETELTQDELRTREMRLFSTETLREELAAREKVLVSKKPPDEVAYKNFHQLVLTIREGTAQSLKDGYEREDFKHYVYEAAMEAVYGKEYWDWHKKQNWG